MPRLRNVLLPGLAVLFIATAARPCGPDFPSATFVLTTGPDGNYANYAAGHLGVIQSGYFTRQLVVAYDYLTHRPLSPDEQKQAIATNAALSNPWQADDDAHKSAPPSGASQWLAARTPFGQLDQDDPASQPASRSVPGENYDSFDNCLDDAFANAARTLQSRIAAHGPKDPAVLDWVRGQDAVFSNCGDGKPTPFYGPGTPPPPPPAPHAPIPAPANAPLWLKQDRAYQLAAAQFYALDFDTAIASFHSIAADTTSPWSPIARYLIARCYIRKATLGSTSTAPSQPDPAPRDHTESGRHKTFALAQHELLTLQSAEKSDPRVAALHNATQGLLDFVNLRLQPDDQAIVLAERLHGQPAQRFGQSLIDLTWLRNGPYGEAKTIGAGAEAKDPTGMLAWIAAVSSSDEATSLQQWRATHSTAWLLAAISFAGRTDAASPELLRAAAAVPTTDPGYTAITYHRLRLQPRSATTRTELLVLIPRIEKDANGSTINLFTGLNAATATTLNDWLAAAPRYSVADDTVDSIFPDATTAVSGTIENVCGHKLTGDAPLFDIDASLTLNRRMPLRLLAEAAESNSLPENLRFQVAQAAWARALLLDTDGSNPAYQAIARRMEPVLIGCRATWKPVLDAYNAATTPAARHAAALLALMRFASTEPSVRYGEERRNGFATYDEFRQNWWCRTVPTPGGTIDEYSDMNVGPKLDPQIEADNPPPLFLTPADLAEARTEVAALEQIPNASTYFAQQALAWAKLHPKDPSTPDILGEADRVLRNSCRKDPPFDQKTGQQIANPNDMTLTPNLAQALFTVLHRDYPTSPWAKRYKSWQ